MDKASRRSTGDPDMFMMRTGRCVCCMEPISMQMWAKSFEVQVVVELKDWKDDNVPRYGECAIGRCHPHLKARSIHREHNTTIS